MDRLMESIGRSPIWGMVCLALMAASAVGQGPIDPAPRPSPPPGMPDLPAIEPPPPPKPAAGEPGGGKTVTLAAEEVQALRAQLELQQKQIETLTKMTRLMAEKLGKIAPDVPSAEALADVEQRAARIEAGAGRAAARDKQTAAAVDRLNDRLDVLETKPTLPSSVREMILPMKPLETPMSIYGQIFGDYAKPNGRNGSFDTPGFSPYFLLQLRNRLLLEATLDFTSTGVAVGTAQMDWFINNNMTLVAGRFLTPIGFFNERLNHEWINKLPDEPLMFRQVSPQISTDGIQLRGGKYLGRTPIKLEYSAFLGNGFQSATKPGDLNGVADLGGLTGGPDAVDSRAYGGRIGYWYPELGLTGGLSGYTNGIYAPGMPGHYDLWQLDAGYHKGNWDFRMEYANATQGARALLNHDIGRQGLYAQVAYRDYASKHFHWQRLEFVGRYSFAYFKGIDPAKLDLSAFDNRVDAPVNRNQYTLGVNYYFYPSMFVKFAYEINREVGKQLNDNYFLAQAIWAF